MRSWHILALDGEALSYVISTWFNPPPVQGTGAIPHTDDELISAFTLK